MGFGQVEGERGCVMLLIQTTRLRSELGKYKRITKYDDAEFPQLRAPEKLKQWENQAESMPPGTGDFHVVSWPASSLMGDITLDEHVRRARIQASQVPGAVTLTSGAW